MKSLIIGLLAFIGLSFLIFYKNRFITENEYLVRKSHLADKVILQIIKKEIKTFPNKIEIVLNFRSDKKMKLQKLKEFLTANDKGLKFEKFRKTHPVWQMNVIVKRVERNEESIRELSLKYLKIGFDFDTELDHWEIKNYNK